MPFNLYDLFPLQYHTEIRLLGREIIKQVMIKVVSTKKDRLTFNEILVILEDVIEAPSNTNVPN